jgi:hypothetical protein
MLSPLFLSEIIPVRLPVCALRFVIAIHKINPKNNLFTINQSYFLIPGAKKRRQYDKTVTKTKRNFKFAG